MNRETKIAFWLLNNMWKENIKVENLTRLKKEDKEDLKMHTDLILENRDQGRKIPKNILDRIRRNGSLDNFYRYCERLLQFDFERKGVSFEDESDVALIGFLLEKIRDLDKIRVEPELKDDEKTERDNELFRKFISGEI